MGIIMFLELFWGWMTVIVSGILFVHPSILHELKKLVVEDRGFGIMYGFRSTVDRFYFI